MLTLDSKELSVITVRRRKWRITTPNEWNWKIEAIGSYDNETQKAIKIQEDVGTCHFSIINYNLDVLIWIILLLYENIFKYLTIKAGIFRRVVLPFIVYIVVDLITIRKILNKILKIVIIRRRYFA